MLNLRWVDLPGDLAALENLVARIEEHDGHPAMGERKYFHLLDSPSDSDAFPPGLVAEDDGGRMVGYLATLEEDSRLWTVEAAVSPDCRSDGHLTHLLAEAGRAVGTGEEEAFGCGHMFPNWPGPPRGPASSWNGSFTT